MIPVMGVGMMMACGPLMLFMILARAPVRWVQLLSPIGLLLTLSGTGLYAYTQTHHPLLALAIPSYALLAAAFANSRLDIQWESGA